jgi:hypothetical protein
MQRVEYTGPALAICEAVRSFPNPPTGDGANVEHWDVGESGAAVPMVELTIIAGAAVELAAGAMLVAEEVHNTYPEESEAVTLTNGSEIVNLAAHGFKTGDGPVRLSGTLPAQLSLTTEYWVIRVDADTFQLALSRANALAGTEVAFGTDGADVVLHWVTSVKSSVLAVSAIDATENTYTSAAHGRATGDRCQVANAGGALPTGLSADTDYFLIVVDAATLKFATTAENAAAGTAIDWSDGSGTQTVIVNDYGATEATVYLLFALINGGEALELTDDIAYREKFEHRPGVVAYHLVASLDDFVPLTSYVRGIREVD